MIGFLMGIFAWLRVSAIGRALAALFGVLGAIFLVYQKGRRSARRKMEARAQRRRAEDMERIAQDMAEAGNDPDAARRWLEAFGKERD